jgi:hypothetical protein
MRWLLLRIDTDEDGPGDARAGEEEEEALQEVRRPNGDDAPKWSRNDPGTFATGD